MNQDTKIITTKTCNNIVNGGKMKKTHYDQSC
jgi:hypothetical protein